MSPKAAVQAAIRTPLGTALSLIVSVFGLIAAIGWVVRVEPKALTEHIAAENVIHMNLNVRVDSLAHAVQDVDLLVRAECLKAQQPIVKAALKCDAH